MFGWHVFELGVIVIATFLMNFFKTLLTTEFEKS